MQLKRLAEQALGVAKNEVNIRGKNLLITIPAGAGNSFEMSYEARINFDGSESLSRAVIFTGRMKTNRVVLEGVGVSFGSWHQEFDIDLVSDLFLDTGSGKPVGNYFDVSGVQITGDKITGSVSLSSTTLSKYKKGWLERFPREVTQRLRLSIISKIKGDAGAKDLLKEFDSLEPSLIREIRNIMEGVFKSVLTPGKKFPAYFKWDKSREILNLQTYLK